MDVRHARMRLHCPMPGRKVALEWTPRAALGLAVVLNRAPSSVAAMRNPPLVKSVPVDPSEVQPEAELRQRRSPGRPPHAGPRFVQWRDSAVIASMAMRGMDRPSKRNSGAAMSSEFNAPTPPKPSAWAHTEHWRVAEIKARQCSSGALLSPPVRRKRNNRTCCATIIVVLRASPMASRGAGW